MPWGPQKDQLFSTAADAVSVLDQIGSVLEELRAENPLVTTEPPIQISGTIRHIQSKSRLAKFSQPIAFAIEIAKGVGGAGAILSISAQGGDVAGTSSKRGLALIAEALERRGVALDPLSEATSPSDYVNRQMADAYGRVSSSMIFGQGFETALKEGVDLEPAYWVNRAIQLSPWDESDEIVERVRAVPGPLDEEHEVFGAANELKSALDAAEQGVLGEEALLELHDAATMMIRWTFMSAARWLLSRHPARVEAEKSAEENERSIFELLRYDLRMFDSVLIRKRNKGEAIPLLQGIGGACFEILGARQRLSEMMSVPPRDS